MRLMLISALMIGVAVAAGRATQQGPPRLSPEAEELQKRFPYPVIRDMRGVVPPGPRPLPSPALGDGPWEVRSTLPSNRIARVLFALRQGRILALHGFIKKTQKTPDEDLALARRRNREFEA